jgi:hypothetical protein
VTKKERQHLDRVTGLGCIACLYMGYEDTPAGIHHLREGMGMGMHSSHWRSIPLCPGHHRYQEAGKIAFHRASKQFERAYDTEENFLRQVYEILRSRYPKEYPSVDEKTIDFNPEHL